MDQVHRAVQSARLLPHANPFARILIYRVGRLILFVKLFNYWHRKSNGKKPLSSIHIEIMICAAVCGGEPSERGISRHAFSGDFSGLPLRYALCQIFQQLCQLFACSLIWHGVDMRKYLVDGPSRHEWAETMLQRGVKIASAPCSCRFSANNHDPACDNAFVCRLICWHNRRWSHYR